MKFRPKTPIKHRWDVRKNFFYHSGPGRVDRMLVTIRDHDQLLFRTVILDIRPRPKGAVLIATYACSENINLFDPSELAPEKRVSPIVKTFSKAHRIYENRSTFESFAASFVRKMRR